MNALVELFRNYQPPPKRFGATIRWGMVWFAVLFLCAWFNTVLFTLVIAATCGLAALQAAGSWRDIGRDVHQGIAATGATSIVLLAFMGGRWVACGSIVMAVAAYVVEDPRGWSISNPEADARSVRLSQAATTMRTGWFFGIAGAAMVSTRFIELLAVMYIIAVTSAYDSGKFLIQSSYPKRSLGLLSGLLGAFVVVVSISQLPPKPFEISEAFQFGCIAVLSLPLGEVLGSWILSAPQRISAGTRRIDSCLLCAPILYLGARLVQ